MKKSILFIVQIMVIVDQLRCYVKKASLKKKNQVTKTTKYSKKYRLK